MASKQKQFSPKAALLWQAMPLEQQLLLQSVYCCSCRGSVSMVKFSGTVKNGALMLAGSCSVCGQQIGRYVEV